MEAFSLEKSIIEGEKEVKELFDFIESEACSIEAYEAEREILGRLMKIGLAALKAYFAQKGTGDVGKQVEVENSVVLKKVGGLRGKNYFSVFGKLAVPRSYYHKKDYFGFAPLDRQANLPDRCYSYLLQEWMSYFSLKDSFGEAEMSLGKLLNLKVQQSRIEVVSEESANYYNKFYRQKPLPEAESEGKLQVMSFDGKGVPMIKREAAKLKGRLGKGEKRQKKKEAVVGVSYTVDRKIRTPEEVAENLVYPEKAKEKRLGQKEEVIKAKNIRRLASLERSREEVMEKIVQDAKARDPKKQRPWVVVMDGALGLWSLIATVLKEIFFIGILDIIHVTEYLWAVANPLYGENTPEAKQWVYGRLLAILSGRVGGVIGGLKQMLTKQQDKLNKTQCQAINNAITYFENHRSWMKYDQYLSAGYPIGSGVVEASCSHVVKKRMEGSGRRWSVEGAEAILLLRSIYTSNDWDQYWELRRKQEKERLYYEFRLAS